MCLLKIGLLDVEHYLRGGFLPFLLLCCFVKDILALKGEEITSLIGVSCMKRKKIKALYESF
jgi:hypothetical protein